MGGPEPKKLPISSRCAAASVDSHKCSNPIGRMATWSAGLGESPDAVEVAGSRGRWISWREGFVLPQAAGEAKSHPLSRQAPQSVHTHNRTYEVRLLVGPAGRKTAAAKPKITAAVLFSSFGQGKILLPQRSRANQSGSLRSELLHAFEAAEELAVDGAGFRDSDLHRIHRGGRRIFGHGHARAAR